MVQKFFKGANGFYLSALFGVLLNGFLVLGLSTDIPLSELAIYVSRSIFALCGIYVVWAIASWWRWGRAEIAQRESTQREDALVA